MTQRLVPDGVFAAAERTPSAPAIVFEGRTLTYEAFAKHILAVASGVDVIRARRVAVSLPNHPVLLEIFFGAIHAGAVFVLCEPRWPVEKFEAMKAAHAPQLMFDHALDAEAWRDRQRAHAILSQPTPDMPFLIGFTSGTTGTPKAFMRSHASWTASFAASAREYGISAETRMLVPGPLSHGLSLYAAVETLNAGGCVFIEPRFDAARMMDLARHTNTIAAAPTVLDMMLEAAASQTVPNIGTIITAGAKLPSALRARSSGVFPNANVIEYYGASELSFVTVAKPSEGCPPDSVGRAFSGVELKVDADGVVWIKSAMVSSGYVGETDGTGFRTHEGWATVGDRGVIDANGFLILTGREGDMIISGGLNVYPQEVEAVLSSAADVSSVVVFGEPDARWGQIVTAIIAGSAQLETLKAHCAEHLPSYKHPRRWFRTAGFAYTASGKIDRADIQRKLKAHALQVLS
jgi:acyl-CoA synthetase (AMP-forming)/AMP-acid ligase II